MTTRGRGGSSGDGQVFGEGNNLITKNMSHKSHRNVAQVTQGQLLSQRLTDWLESRST